jgi:hypothetical protein
VSRQLLSTRVLVVRTAEERAARAARVWRTLTRARPMPGHEGDTMSKDVDPAPVLAPASSRRLAVYAVALLVVFLLGFVPMWLTARERARDLAHAAEELRMSRLQNTLASAVVDARRGDYELARQATSRFFTDAGQEVDRGRDSAFTPEQARHVEGLFRERDEIITLLARADPAAAERLTDLFISFRTAVRESAEPHEH